MGLAEKRWTNTTPSHKMGVPRQPRSPDEIQEDTLMCGSVLGTKPKTPAPIEIPTPEAPPPVVDSGTSQAVNAAQEARRRRVQSQEASTLATGGQGLVDQPMTTSKQFFGQ